MKRSLLVASATVVAGLAWSAPGTWSAPGSSNGSSSAKAAQASGDDSAMPLVPHIYRGRLHNEDANVIADLRRAGIQGDVSQIPALRQALENPIHTTYVYTSLHALGQLGVTDALPSVDKIRNGPDEDLRNFAQAARARLLAEGKVQQKADRKAQIADKTRRYYLELGMTPTDMSAGVFAYRNPKTTAEGYGVLSSEPGPTPVAVYAIRGMADMIYRDSLTPGVYQEYAALPEVAAVDFSQDYASALKMRLAALTHSERVTTLITELSNKKVLRAEDDYEIQLAINEGVAAVPAIADKLGYMALHRDECGYIGFAALFTVLRGIGDPNMAPLIKPFLQDKDNWVTYYANQNYRDVQRAIKRDRIQAY